MKKKPPVVDGTIPDEIIDLESMTELQSIQTNDYFLNPKIADEYDHYPSCKWAIVEYKSRSLKDAVAQLEDTALKLSYIDKEVNFAFIVAYGMNRTESRIFEKKGNLLRMKHNKAPVKIKYGSSRIEVRLYYSGEIQRQYRKYSSSMMPYLQDNGEA